MSHQHAERELGKHDPPLIMPASEEIWREIAWDGIVFRLPVSWQPAVIRKSYLFFEHLGQPVFAIKWEHIHGRFSAERILKRVQDSFRHTGSTLVPWNVQAELPDIPRDYSMTGFQYQDENETILGILLYCAHCRRAAILHLYTADPGNRETLHAILQSYADHHDKAEQTWSIYDIKAQLPAQAVLKSHEFLAGRYTLSFVLDKTAIDLYRFKPAGAILRNQNLQEFGDSLAGEAVCVRTTEEKLAWWEYTASGIDRLAVFSGRKPGWIWLRVELIKDKNAILAVKGSGRGATNRRLMEQIAENFTVTEVG